MNNVQLKKHLVTVGTRKEPGQVPKSTKLLTHKDDTVTAKIVTDAMTAGVAARRKSRPRRSWAKVEQDGQVLWKK